jgi:tRNA (guanine37-N1)-methyltransferase
MRFDVVTLFPAMFAAITDQGITRRACEQGLWSLTTWNPRDFTADAHRTIDDRPYGGGPGMVMMAEPLALTLEAIRGEGGGARVIATAPGGTPDRRDRAGVGGAGRIDGCDLRALRGHRPAFHRCLHRRGDLGR